MRNFSLFLNRSFLIKIHTLISNILNNFWCFSRQLIYSLNPENGKVSIDKLIVWTIIQKNIGRVLNSEWFNLNICFSYNFSQLDENYQNMITKGVRRMNAKMTNLEQQLAQKKNGQTTPRKSAEFKQHDWQSQRNVLLRKRLERQRLEIVQLREEFDRMALLEYWSYFGNCRQSKYTRPAVIRKLISTFSNNLNLSIIKMDIFVSFHSSSFSFSICND